MVGQESSVHCALWAFIRSLVGCDHPSGQFFDSSLTILGLFLGSGVCDKSRMTGPFQDWIAARLVFGI